MKRESDLYRKICDKDNILLAHMNAKKGKRHYAEVKMVDGRTDFYIQEIRSILAGKIFKNSNYTVFTRCERGKSRVIYKLPYYPDRIIHHAVMNILEPIWAKVFIRDTYASMPGRGIHDGVRRMKSFLKDVPGTRYCLKLDVRKFYPSINHGCLKTIIRRKIKCKDTLWLLDSIIDSADGVPIGNYLSQWFANLYLAYFDHWAKNDLGIRYYARYCDDIVILHPDKARLRGIFDAIRGYLADHLGLAIKSNWQIFPVADRGVDFLGYRFFGPYTLIRKSIAGAFKRKCSRVSAGKPCRNPCSSIMSYYGWLKHGNAAHLWAKYANDDLTLALAGQVNIPRLLR